MSGLEGKDEGRRKEGPDAALLFATIASLVHLASLPCGVEHRVGVSGLLAGRFVERWLSALVDTCWTLDSYVDE